MTVKDITKRILVGLLVVTMTLTYIPKSAFAVTQPVQDKPAAEATATEINEQTRDDCLYTDADRNASDGRSRIQKKT